MRKSRLDPVVVASFFDADTVRSDAYRDEFVVLCRSRSAESADIAILAAACETATWAYRHIRLRRFYWLDKRLFVRRIFRTVHLFLGHEQRGKPASEIQLEMAVLLIGERTVWFGSVGDCGLFVVRSGVVHGVDPDVSAKTFLGRNRVKPTPHFAPVPILKGDTLIFFVGVLDRLYVQHGLSDLLQRKEHGAQFIGDSLKKSIPVELRRNLGVVILKSSV